MRLSGITFSGSARRAAARLASAAALATLMHAAAAGSEFLDPAQAFRGSARVLDAAALELHIAVAPGYHLYRERLAVELDGAGTPLGAVEMPAGETRYDDNFQKNVELLRGAVRIRVPVQGRRADFRLRVSYQGCAEQGLCYPPQTAFVAARVSGGQLTGVSWQGDDAASVAAPAAAAARPAAAAVSDTVRVASALESGNLLTISGVFLVAGLLLSCTPCVLPMVPILSSIIVGQGGPVSRRRGFTLALAYALGMAAVYTVFGVLAGLLGEGLAAALQNPWVLGTFALLLVALSLSMFGVYELQMPGFIQSRISQTSGRLPGGRLAGVFVMGGLSALIVGPCVAAPLAGALVFISRTQDVLIGGLALFSLAIGMSVPLLLVGVSAGALLPRAGAWMQGVKSLFGALLLAVALWIVAPVLPGWALMSLIGTGLLLGAVALGLLERPAEPASGGQRLAKGLALVLALLGSAQVVGVLSGGDNPLQPLRHLAGNGGGAGPAVAMAMAGTQSADFRRIRTAAELDTVLASAGRPVMLDFYADWCVSCKEMEHLTFSDPLVRARLAHAVLLQADVTAHSSDDRALLKRFGLFGPPGVLFFGADGQERAEARVIGFLPPPDFAAALTTAGL